MAHTEEDALLEGYRQAAAGAQKLAESIDILLPALISIAGSKSVTAAELRKIADSAVISFEEHRGQTLNRNRYMAKTRQAEASAVAEALHTVRNA